MEGIPSELLVGLGGLATLTLYLVRALDNRSDAREILKELRAQRDFYKKELRRSEVKLALFIEKYGPLDLQYEEVINEMDKREGPLVPKGFKTRPEKSGGTPDDSELQA